MVCLPQWPELVEEILEFFFNLSEPHLVRQILRFPGRELRAGAMVCAAPFRRR